MRLYLYRLSLTEETNGTLFEGEGEIDRARYLQKWFERSFDFTAWGGKNLRYQYVQTDGNFISGAICRWISEQEKGDPEDPFAITEGGRWFRASFFLNFGNDEQVVGLENVPRIGAPGAVIRYLVDEINARSGDFPFSIDVFSLPVRGSFSEAIRAYPGTVTSVAFDLVVPNPIDSEGSTKEALKRLREKVNADRVKETLESKDGIKTDSEVISERVDYAASGGGEVIAKDGGEIVYDSRKTVRDVEVSDEFIQDGGEKPGLAASMTEALKR